MQGQRPGCCCLRTAKLHVCVSVGLQRGAARLTWRGNWSQVWCALAMKAPSRGEVVSGAGWRPRRPCRQGGGIRRRTVADASQEGVGHGRCSVYLRGDHGVGRRSGGGSFRWRRLGVSWWRGADHGPGQRQALQKGLGACGHQRSGESANADAPTRLQAGCEERTGASQRGRGRLRCTALLTRQFLTGGRAINCRGRSGCQAWHLRGAEASALSGKGWPGGPGRRALASTAARMKRESVHQQRRAQLQRFTTSPRIT